MIISLWRYAHLALALLSSLFLVVLSLTGIVLAADAALQKTQNYKSKEFYDLTLAEVIPTLSAKYPEISDVTIDHNQFVSIEATDENGDAIHQYIDPKTGASFAPFVQPSAFIQWTTNLHRSLFMKETGRIIVGVSSFLLLLISISGVILIVRRQQGIRNFFDRIHNDNLFQTFHVVAGRILLLPVLLLALTGTLLLFVRLGWIGNATRLPATQSLIQSSKNFELFKTIPLQQVQKIEFPFIADDPEDYYTLKLKDREIQVNAATGDVESISLYPYSQIVERISLDWHTGRNYALLAIILGVSSLNILLFVYSGFTITLRRSNTKIKNKYTSKTAEIIILAGSENGSTLAFAEKIHQQFIELGYKSYLTDMNHFEVDAHSKYLLILTSTYGLGTAPSNAGNFENLIQKASFSTPIDYAVLGFGSTSYPNFCAYAQHIDSLLNNKENLNRILPLQTINERSIQQVAQWANALNEKLSWSLSTTPANYAPQKSVTQSFEVTEKTEIDAENHTFKLVLKPIKKNKFTSGDLFAIYPKNNGVERLYSIGKVNRHIQLLVKKYPNGLGSEYLYQLKAGNIIKAKIVKNSGFNFPKKVRQVAMISNGTGIAPFLGMIAHNTGKAKIHLYSGFRNQNNLTDSYSVFAKEQLKLKTLTHFEIAFSREQNKIYVLDLIKRDADYFVNLLENQGVVMICGSLQMQKDVEQVLSELPLQNNFENYNNQILADCY